MSELAIEVQNQELANFDFDYEYQQELEQVELMNKYGLQKFNELFEVTA